jgi:ATP-dependent protease ClpP protease subunit
MDREKVFTAADAVAYGLADAVIDKRVLPAAR